MLAAASLAASSDALWAPEKQSFYNKLLHSVFLPGFTDKLAVFKNNVKEYWKNPNVETSCAIVSCGAVRNHSRCIVSTEECQRKTDTSRGTTNITTLNEK